MGAEAALRQRHRDAIRASHPRALIVGQPANAYTGPGRHDLYVVVQGRYVGLELKVSTGRATKIQLQRITDTRRAGGWAWVVRTPAQSLGAINAALQGVTMPDTSDFDFDSLFGKDGATPAETPMSAFLAEPDTQVAVQSQIPVDETPPSAPEPTPVDGPRDWTSVYTLVVSRLKELTEAIDANSVLLQDLLARLGAEPGVLTGVADHPADPEPAVKKGRSKAAPKAAAPSEEPESPSPSSSPEEAIPELSLEDFLSGPG